MADLAGAYEGGVRTGEGIAQTGVEAFKDAANWRDKLKVRAQAHQDAADALKTEAARYQDKLKEADRTDTETEQHDIAIENEWAPGSRGSGGRSGMTDDQRRSIARIKIMSDYGRDQNYGNEISPEREALYRQSVSDEYKYQHPGAPAPKPPAAAAEKKDDGWTISGLGEAKHALDAAVQKGRDYFSSPSFDTDADPIFESTGRAQAHPQSGPAPRVKMLNGKKIHETSPGVWANDEGKVVWRARQ